MSLIERLEAAEVGSRDLDAELHLLFPPKCLDDALASHRVTQSLDAASALAERVMPRWGWDIGMPARMGEHGGQPWADCWPPVEDGEPRTFRFGGYRPTPFHSNAATPALALCCAILKAVSKDGDAK